MSETWRYTVFGQCYPKRVHATLGWEQKLRRRKDKGSIMVLREACPQCRSRWDKRNGRLHMGKQDRCGKVCGRAFVLHPEHQVITAEQRTRSSGAVM
jgi:hypothetical protein